jgi:hypothetical protein
MGAALNASGSEAFRVVYRPSAADYAHYYSMLIDTPSIGARNDGQFELYLGWARYILTIMLMATGLFGAAYIVLDHALDRRWWFAFFAAMLVFSEWRRTRTSAQQHSREMKSIFWSNESITQLFEDRIEQDHGGMTTTAPWNIVKRVTYNDKCLVLIVDEAMGGFPIFRAGMKDEAEWIRLIAFAHERTKAMSQPA